MIWNDGRLSRERKRHQFCDEMVPAEEGARDQSLAQEALIIVIAWRQFSEKRVFITLLFWVTNETTYGSWKFQLAYSEKKQVPNDESLATAVPIKPIQIFHLHFLTSLRLKQIFAQRWRWRLLIQRRRG